MTLLCDWLIEPVGNMYGGNISSRFSGNSEAFASELPENLEEMDSDVINIIKWYQITHWCVTRRERVSFAQFIWYYTIVCNFYSKHHLFPFSPGTVCTIHVFIHHQPVIFLWGRISEFWWLKFLWWRIRTQRFTLVLISINTSHIIAMMLLAFRLSNSSAVI